MADRYVRGKRSDLSLDQKLSLLLDTHTDIWNTRLQPKCHVRLRPKSNVTQATPCLVVWFSASLSMIPLSADLCLKRSSSSSKPSSQSSTLH